MNSQEQREGHSGNGSTGQPRRSLIVHIGDHKTGTTSIQNALGNGELRFDGVDVFYVPPDQNFLAKPFRSLARGAEGKEGDRARDKVQRYADEMAASGAPLAVISAENLEGIEPQAFREVLERYFSETFDEIRIVAYVRPHAQRILSSFAERTKIGTFYGDLNDFFQDCKRRKMVEYHPRFQRWREVFGADFVLRPFVRGELLRKSIVDDFASVSFPGRAFTVVEGGVQNESLSLEDLMRVKFVQQELLETDINQHAAGWVLHNLLADMPRAETQTRLQIHRPLAKRIANVYREDARQMDQDFFGGKKLLEGELDKSIEGALPRMQSSNPADYFEPSELRSLLLLSRFAPLLRDERRLRQPEHVDRLRHPDAKRPVKQYQKHIEKLRTGGGKKKSSTNEGHKAVQKGKRPASAKWLLSLLRPRNKTP